MLKTIVLWVVEALLNWLASGAKTYVEDKIETAQVEVVNAENVKKYEAAKTRLERIKAAEKLLNSVKS